MIEDSRPEWETVRREVYALHHMLRRIVESLDGLNGSAIVPEPIRIRVGADRAFAVAGRRDEVRPW